MITIPTKIMAKHQYRPKIITTRYQRSHRHQSKPVNQTTNYKTTKPVLNTIAAQPTENKQTEHPKTDPQIETETEPQTKTETESDTETKFTTRTAPTLTPYEKKVYSPERHKHILYWRGYVTWGGKTKKRYDLFPNQLYNVIINRKNPNFKELDTDFKGNHTEHKDIQNEIRQSSRYFDIGRRKETPNIVRITAT